MNIEAVYQGWTMGEGRNRLAVVITNREHDRGGQLGRTDEYGSVVTIGEGNDRLITILSITDLKHPNCKSSLADILTTHSRQMKLGTFGEVHAPHHSDYELLITPLRRLGIDHIHDDVKEYVQIPFFFAGDQHWEFRTKAIGVYVAYRKYDGSYYTTKIERTLDNFVHPLREGVPDNNIISRKEVIEFTSLTAKPLDFSDATNLFN
ncbi:hypothetical protein AH04_153 [Erwinia phage AH04]|uniref:Uncharacterized protein n=1 Tax=Erwinia phage AH04 TaxID=2869569 RepID=A0AAE7X1L8_9CAUD|nr:hypothetical protein PQC02_gp161 [Erwinia phage AH04]QZA70629.1 hypothetical protein AH04_153 [Erwinia phage AH04]